LGRRKTLKSVKFKKCYTKPNKIILPVLVGLHSLHEEIGDPQGIEKVTGAVFVLAGVLAEVEEPFKRGKML